MNIEKEPEEEDKEPSVFPKQDYEQMASKYHSFILRGHGSTVICLSMNYDELYCLSGSSDMSIRLWCLRK